MTTLDARRRGGHRLAVALAATVAALAAGCSVDVPGADGDAVVGSDPARDGDQPLLREDDLADGYRAAVPGEGQDLTPAGCLAEVTGIGSAATGETSVTFTTDDPFDSMLITHTVLGFRDDASSADALSTWQRTAASCDVVEYAQQDSVLRLEVSADDQTLGRAVTEQVNVVATGEIDSGTLDIDVSQWISVARVQDHLSVVRVLDLDDHDAVDEGRRLARLTADRLDAWTD